MDVVLVYQYDAVFHQEAIHSDAVSAAAALTMWSSKKEVKFPLVVPLLANEEEEKHY